MKSETCTDLPWFSVVYSAYVLFMLLYLLSYVSVWPQPVFRFWSVGEDSNGAADAVFFYYQIVELVMQHSPMTRGGELLRGLYDSWLLSFFAM